MERAIGIIKREIEKRKSMLLNKEYFLRNNQIKCEIESLDKALEVVNDIETPVKVTMLKQLEELSGYIPAEIYARKVIEIQKQFL